MDLSRRWLSDYVDVPPMSDRDFSEKMTMSGSKVERWETEGSEIKNVVVGKVLELVKHPDSDHLWVTQIDIGSKKLQIVTGAQNLKVSDLVPVALDNSVLPGGKEIHSTKMRGVDSFGMLCSLGELGLTINDFPYAIENGIFVIEEDCKLGQDICSAIGFNDTLVEFEITSNRPDCMSVTGLAREAAATFGADFNLKKPVIKKETGNINDILKVRVENPALCPRYIARAVTNVKIGPSPRWIRERLRTSGVRPINNIVDITNFVMLEYGQPMHAFDINCMQNHEIIVRNAKDNESIVTLDGTERKLGPEMLVIADSTKPSAVAGVMGGENSGIHDETVTVIFESANFNGTSVRKTAQKLGMRTEASGRFEKGLDAAICPTAADRACELVEMLNCGTVVGGSIDINNADLTPFTLPLTVDWINKFIGFNVSEKDMIKTLEKIDFKVKDGIITVPSFRADVRHKADVAEEIARFYGYDKIDSSVLSGVAVGHITHKQDLQRRTINTLLAQGMYEICTYTFISPKVFDKLNLPKDSQFRKTVNIANPLGEDTSVMRTTIYHSMLEVLARNYNNRNASGAFFELGKEFIPNTDNSKLPTEKEVIALGMYGDGTDYFKLKGILETLFEIFGITDYDITKITDNPIFHPGRCGEITVNGRLLATIGEVHPVVLNNYNLSSRAYMARIDQDTLFDLSNAGNRIYKPMPRFPASSRDIALVCDDSLPLLTIEKALKKAVGTHLESIKLFDFYKGNQIESGKKSLAFSLSFRASDHTLTDTELAEAMDEAVKAISELGAKLRS